MDDFRIQSGRRTSDGGLPARRAVTHWAWRLFKREWRQQFLILALITVAVAATILGSSVAVNNPPPKDAGFGTAPYSVGFASDSTKAQTFIAKAQHLGTVQVIENETFSIPGSINTYQLRAQAAPGPFGGPMLSLLSGHYPSNASQVDVTSGVATAFHLSVGKTWQVGGVTRDVVGIVQNPQSLLDEFALVVPGSGTEPVTGHRALSRTEWRAAHTRQGRADQYSRVGRGLEPVESGDHLTRRARPRACSSSRSCRSAASPYSRSAACAPSACSSRSAPPIDTCASSSVPTVRSSVSPARSLVSSSASARWLAYRPSFEASAHHLVGVFALPWLVVILAMVLAVVAAYFASSRPARAVTKVPIVHALSGRPAPPRQIHRSALPGIVLLVAAFLLLGYSGSTGGGNGNGGAPELLLGLVLLMPGLILLAPFFLSLTERASRHSPIAAKPRCATSPGTARAPVPHCRRSVSGSSSRSSLCSRRRHASATSSTTRDRTSLQISSRSIRASRPRAKPSTVETPRVELVRVRSQKRETATPAELAVGAKQIAAGLGAQLVALDTPNAELSGTQGGRNWSGQIYVATPQLLRAFGIKESQIDPKALVLTSRPGLSGVNGLVFDYSTAAKLGPGQNAPGGSLRDPLIQEMSALPAGTSAPNTVITEYAMKRFHIGSATSDWLVVGSHSFTAAQISSAQLTASTAQLQVESRNDIPSGSTIVNYATLFGILIALGVLAMSVGLVRSETSSELRTWRQRAPRATRAAR